MRRYLFFFILLISKSAYALLGDVIDSEHLREEPFAQLDIDQVQVIENLIDIEEKKLIEQKKLKGLIMSLKSAEEAFFKDPKNKKTAFQLVKTARAALEIISAMKIDHLFSQNFLEDLEFYSSIAGKQKPSRPD